jgi:Trypsin-like peptidase domain
MEASWLGALGARSAIRSGLLLTSPLDDRIRSMVENIVHPVGDRMIDFVFPVVAVKRVDHQTLDYRGLLGTGFLVKNGDGLGLTAGHVADNIVTDRAAALFRDVAGVWQPRAITIIDRHANDDLALIRVEGITWQSALFVTSAAEYGSAHYSMWGYPLDVTNEQEENGRIAPRPDLIFSEGHIRRRLTDIKFRGITGRKMYELSNVAGSGCSGSPVCIRQPGRHPFEVIGVYIGERYSEADHVSVAFAVRSEAILDVWPHIGSLAA